MYGNYYGVAQPPMPKWYNPNRFNAADAALAYFFSAIGLLILQFVVILEFSFLEEVDFAMDIVFTVLSQSLMVGIALLMGKKKGVNVIRGGGTYLDGKQSHFALVLLCFFIAVTIFSPITDLVEWACFTPEELASMNIEGEGALLLVFYVLLVVGPAVGEELLFRGVITNGLREYGKGTAIILSSAAFTLMHTNPLQTVYQFMLGILFGLVYVETKSLLPSMLLHGMNNALSGVSSFVYAIENPLWKGVYYAVTVALGLLAIVWLVYATVKKKEGGNKFVTALYPQRSAYEEELLKVNGRYYAAVKTALNVGFTDETIVFSEEQPLKGEHQGKWFFSERFGWRPFNNKSKKWKVVLWFTLAFAINALLWALVLATLKGWISL